MGRFITSYVWRFKKGSILRVVILTQDERSILPDAVDYLLRRLGHDIEIVGAVVFSASPFGKSESVATKVQKVLSIFGLRFAIQYSFVAAGQIFFGRGSVRRVFSDHGIEVIEAGKNINAPQELQVLESYDADILLSITGNQIFKRPLIDLPRLGILNLHTALLPKYRGLMPTFWVLKNREKETGVSVFWVDEGIDSGPIVVQKRVALSPSISQRALVKTTKILGMEAIVEALNKIKSGDHAVMTNDDQHSSYCKFPSAEDVREFRKYASFF